MILWNDTLPVRPTVKPIVPPTVRRPDTVAPEVDRMIAAVCVALEPARR